jgi:hypothetical protein
MPAHDCEARELKARLLPEANERILARGREGYFDVAITAEGELWYRFLDAIFNPRQWVILGESEAALGCDRPHWWLCLRNDCPSVPLASRCYAFHFASDEQA